MESPVYKDLVVPKGNKSGLVLKGDPKNIPNYGEFFAIDNHKSDLTNFPKVTLERINLESFKLLSKNKSSRTKEDVEITKTLTSRSQTTVLLNNPDTILLSDDSSINSPISSKKSTFSSERRTSSNKKTITPISSSASSIKLCLSTDSIASPASSTNGFKVMDEKFTPLIRTKMKLPDGILNTDNFVDSVQNLYLTPTVRVERMTESFIKSFCKQKSQESRDRSRSRAKKRKSKNNTKSPLRSVSVSSKELNEHSDSCKSESKALSKSSSNNKLKKRSKSESRPPTKSKSPTRNKSRARSRTCFESESRDVSEDCFFQSKDINSVKSNRKSRDPSKKSKMESVNLPTSSSSNESSKSQKLRNSPCTNYAKSPGTSGKFEKNNKVSLSKLTSAISLETSSPNGNSSKTDKTSNLGTQSSSCTEPSKTNCVIAKDNHSRDKNSNESQNKRKNLSGEKKKSISCEVPKNDTVVEDTAKGTKHKRSFKTRVVTNGNSRKNTLQPGETSLEKRGTEAKHMTAYKGEKTVSSDKMEEERKISEMKEVFERAGYNLKDVCRKLDLKAFKEGLKNNPSKRIYVGLTKSLDE